MRSAPEIGSSLAGDLRISALRLLRRLRSEQTPDALSGVHFSALDSVAQHGALTPRELANREQVQPPTMTRLIADLQAGGLISRRVDPDDRRRQILEVTPAGTELLASANAAKLRWLCAHLSELTEEERATLRAAIPIINHIAGD
jgi:DNA-binding MarR family transcriptional regulator